MIYASLCQTSVFINLTNLTLNLILRQLQALNLQEGSLDQPAADVNAEGVSNQCNLKPKVVSFLVVTLPKSPKVPPGSGGGRR
jgi:hypothetical protein